MVKWEGGLLTRAESSKNLQDLKYNIFKKKSAANFFCYLLFPQSVHLQNFICVLLKQKQTAVDVWKIQLHSAFLPIFRAQPEGHNSYAYYAYVIQKSGFWSIHEHKVLLDLPDSCAQGCHMSLHQTAC